MTFWYGLGLIGGIHVLAAMSPGPDWLYVTRQTLTRGRTTGLWCSLGIALGLGVHIAYSVFGLAVVVNASEWLMMLIRIFGGVYLIHLGMNGMRSGPMAVQNHDAPEVVMPKESVLLTLWKGMLCNILNPKAPVYFVALFTSVLSPKMPTWQLAVYGIWMMFLQFLWFATVVLFLSVPKFNHFFQTYAHWLNRILGVMMTGLGFKIIVS